METEILGVSRLAVGLNIIWLHMFVDEGWAQNLHGLEALGNDSESSSACFRGKVKWGKARKGRLQ